jgi:hypothetical protein
MAHSRATVVSLVLMAVGTFIESHNQADASTIVQTASYGFAPHGSSFEAYQQFNPALGPLKKVVIRDVGSAANGDLFFYNTSDEYQTFTLSWSFSVQTDGGGKVASGTLTDTLAPGDFGDISPSTSYALSTTYTNTDFWVGTGDIGAQEYAGTHGSSLIGPLFWTIDNSHIFVDQTDDYLLVGEETITYVYGTVVPEPSTPIMLGTACLILLARQCLQRRRI